MECERFEVMEDGIYKIKYLVFHNQECETTSKELIMPKDIFVEAFAKYISSAKGTMYD